MSLVQVTYSDGVSGQGGFVKPADENENPSTNRTWRLNITGEDEIRIYVDLGDIIRQLPPDRDMFIQQLERLQGKPIQTGLEKRERGKLHRSVCAKMLCVSSPVMMHSGTRKRKIDSLANGSEHSAEQSESHPNLRTFIFPTVSYDTLFMEVPVEISPQDVQNCTECNCSLEGRPVTKEWLIRLLKTRLRNV